MSLRLSAMIKSNSLPHVKLYKIPEMFGKDWYIVDYTDLHMYANVSKSRWVKFCDNQNLKLTEVTKYDGTWRLLTDEKIRDIPRHLLNRIRMIVKVPEEISEIVFIMAVLTGFRIETQQDVNVHHLFGIHKILEQLDKGPSHV